MEKDPDCTPIENAGKTANVLGQMLGAVIPVPKPTDRVAGTIIGNSLEDTTVRHGHNLFDHVINMSDHTGNPDDNPLPEKCYPQTPEAEEAAKNYSQNSNVRQSPISLDLDGNGIEVLSYQNGSQVVFDFNADGIMNHTSWTGKTDGILALDRDGDGQITSGQEIFGDNTLLSDGSKAAMSSACKSQPASISAVGVRAGRNGEISNQAKLANCASISAKNSAENAKNLSFAAQAKSAGKNAANESAHAVKEKKMLNLCALFGLQQNHLSSKFAAKIRYPSNSTLSQIGKI